jgi:hypothetical protein
MLMVRRWFVTVPAVNLGICMYLSDDFITTTKNELSGNYTLPSTNSS